MATAREQNPFKNGGGEAGFGKFRRRPLRRSQTTPYDRPATALRNPNRINGLLSRIVDPAQRFIAYSAHKLFSSVFRKRLPPPPTPPSSETVQEERDNHQEETVFEQVANDSSCKQQGAIVESDAQISISDGGGLTDLEKLLKQKTFTREEVNHLTALMHSRTLDSALREEGRRTEVVPSDPMLPPDQKNECLKTPALENGIQNRVGSNPYVTTSAPIGDVVSPFELAKAYMGNRPSKVSQSMLGLRSQPTEDSTLLKSQHCTLKSPIMSIVPRATSLARDHDNGFLTQNSRGRSAIYSMARTPYARVYPASTQGVGVAVEGRPSSLAQYALDHNILSGSKQMALKRRSSVLDNDIGSVGPIRRIRHKSNLLSSKGLALPHSGSSLSISRSRVGVDAAQQPSSSMQRPILLGEVKHSHMKLSAENIDDSKPGTSFPPLPSRSSETASKILQQLDKSVSLKEKSSELRLPTLNATSSMKLSSSMIRGQALRSMEIVDSSKFLDNIQYNELDGTIGNSYANAEKLTTQIDKVESGPLKLIAPTDGPVPIVTTADATVPRKQNINIAKSGDSSMARPVSYSQKKRAFHMSVHEDYVDLDDDDDDAYPNGDVSFFPLSRKETTGSTNVVDKITSSTEAIVQNPPGSSAVMLSNSFSVHGKPHVGTDNGEKVDVPTSRTSSVPDHTLKPVAVAVTAATQTVLGSYKSASPNGSVANPPLFSFGNKVVQSTELTAANSPSKESNTSGPAFGSEKVISSNYPGTDAPSVNFDINKNTDNVPQLPFTFSSSVDGEFNRVKFGASSDLKLNSSISSSTVAGAVDSIPKVLQSDNADAKTNTVTEFSTRASELAVSSAASTPLLTSTTNIFNFGNSSNQNGPATLSPSFSSSLPSMVTNISTSQNMFSNSSLAASSSSSSSSSYISNTAASTSTSMTTSTLAVIASSNSSSSTPTVTSSSSTPSLFKFGSSPLPSIGVPVSSSSDLEPLETKKQDAGASTLATTSFGSAPVAVGSTGSGIFGFSSSAMTTVNSQPQGSVFGTTSGSVSGAMAPPATSGFASSTQSQSVAFGSSASSPLFGFTGKSAFSSGSSSFPSSNPATNILNSGASFGQSTVASSSEANPVSSNSGTSSTSFGLSSWQPPPFGSSFSSSSSSSSGFSFGASTPSVASTSSPMMFGSTTGASSSPQFSFTSGAATTNMQPAFENPNPVFAFGSSVNNDQMSTEDTMAEDTVQASPPVTPVFGQQPAMLQSNFVFGAPTASGASPFQFASQQNTAPPNTSPFQASGSLEFNSGGSFSVGPGGSDKSGRKIVRVNKNRLRKK
ncbi:PREDICTED: nuclear pore complex protein NUP1-like isoform X2 [Lupinus angustifolius]|uniref:nuclear pore complex protein NUP1-like isoform X2 n=1 Tax=Lupinus angustifolius TaxID=3871 RepID=UPI00092FC7CA|nr:PREDICTED: nuclear pore complex protein NUP1-like isoform X2 [Lupinus angustifolius]